ncbi:MAG: acetolactate synthase [Planctomycetota bacterium]
MSQTPVDVSTARGYQPPVNTQFSVFLDNRVGRLMDLLECFERASAITLAGLSVIDSADHAVVRLLTSDGDLARRLLNRNEHAFSEIDVIAVELPYENSLTSVCQVLMTVELNIHYAYPLLVRPRGLPVVALHTDDVVFAGQQLRKRHFTVLAENDLGENAPGTTPGTPNDPDAV